MGESYDGSVCSLFGGHSDFGAHRYKTLRRSCRKNTGTHALDWAEWGGSTRTGLSTAEATRVMSLGHFRDLRGLRVLTAEKGNLVLFHSSGSLSILLSPRDTPMSLATIHPGIRANAQMPKFRYAFPDRAITPTLPIPYCGLLVLTPIYREDGRWGELTLTAWKADSIPLKRPEILITSA